MNLCVRKARGGARSRWFRAPLLCASLAVVLLGATGCGGAGTTVHATRATVQLAGTEHRFSSRLWRFYRDGGRQPGVANVIDRAEQADLKQCMRRAGFAYHPVSTEPVGGIVLDGLANTPGKHPPAEAMLLRIERTHGFGIAARVQAEHATPPQQNSQYVAALRAVKRRRYFQALYGHGRATIVTFPDGSVDRVPTGGCLGGASDAVYGSISRDDFRLNAVVDVQQLVERDVSQHADMMKATMRWSRCLANRSGRRFATQNDLLAWLTKQYAVLPFRTARRLEIHYATMSTTCMYRTGAEARYAATTWDVLTHMPTAWYRAVVDVRRWDSAALPTAKAVLHRRAHPPS